LSFFSFFLSLSLSLSLSLMFVPFFYVANLDLKQKQNKKFPF
jgi:hypothetical protein